MLNILCAHCTQGKLYWGSHFICPASPYFIPLLSVLFIRIGHDHMISIHISFLILHWRESNSIIWSLWIKPDDEYSDFKSTRCCKSKLETVHFKSFFCFPFFDRHDLSGLKLTKLNLKLYYLPKDIKFADEKLNFQQLFSPVLPEKKLFKSSFIRWFH